MDWFGENFIQVLIAVAAAIAAYINNRRKEKKGEPADFDGDGVPDNRPGDFRPHGGDAEEAERTRRVQEEIRRKIAQRRAGGQQQPPPLVAPRPVAQPIPEVIRRRIEERSAPPPLPPRQTAAQAARDEDVLARQRAIEEQMRLLEKQRAEARRQAAEVSTITSPRRPSGGAKVNGPELLADLRSPGGARRAWILREVLGTPAGLK